MKKQIASYSPEDTRKLAALFLQDVRPGDVIALMGDLGSGKTIFTGGLAQALGIQGPISSPTYTIQQTYKTDSQTLHHIDLYRLSSPEEVDMLDLAQCWEEDAITIIEWADRAEGLLPEDTWQINFTAGTEPNMRIIEIERAS
jgi:tRNA threonylcarbamoyladenosine biosynthesis protein TsaE